MIKIFLFDGSDQEKSFDFTGEAAYIGRSPDNDIQVIDITVSRRHLKALNKKNKYFITDLESKNGTYINGHYLSPGIEYELKEGTPIVIGMSVICLGKECLESVAPFIDSLDFHGKAEPKSEAMVHNRDMSDRKNRALIRKVNNILNESQDVNEISEKILDHILEHFRRVDRGIIILFKGKGTGEIAEKVISRSRKEADYSDKGYSRLIVDKVLKHEKGVFISDVSDEKEIELSDTLKLLNIGSVMCLPLFSGSKLRGVIYVDSIKKPYGFRKEDFSLLTNLSNLAAIAIDEALFYNDLAKEVRDDTFSLKSTTSD